MLISTPLEPGQSTLGDSHNSAYLTPQSTTDRPRMRCHVHALWHTQLTSNQSHHSPGPGRHSDPTCSQEQETCSGSVARPHTCCGGLLCDLGTQPPSTASCASKRLTKASRWQLCRPQMDQAVQHSCCTQLVVLAQTSEKINSNWAASRVAPHLHRTCWAELACGKKCLPSHLHAAP